MTGTLQQWRNWIPIQRSNESLAETGPVDQATSSKSNKKNRHSQANRFFISIRQLANIDWLSQLLEHIKVVGFMWIALVACIEVLRFWVVLSALRQQSLFVGWTGFAAYAVLDWLFFYVVLAVADVYFPLFPNTNWRKNTRLGNFLRRRINMTFRSLDQEPVPKPAVFACHSHGVMATGQLLAFMM